MKPIGGYGWRDWKRLRPLTHWLKTKRYAAVREAYVRRPARAEDATLGQRIRGRLLLVTVAHNDADAVEMQTEALARFVPNALFVIADNSTDRNAAAEIAAIAARRAIPLIRLPAQPRRHAAASRAHGLALNWVWRNIVQPAAPVAFGFIDHDLFPTAPDDPFAFLERQPVYGARRMVGDQWFLWAGFCFFKFDAVADLPLDFGQDWFNGLDTGGGNWNVLYRHLDRTALTFQRTRFEPYQPGADPVHDSIQWCGAWLHEVGQTRRAGRMREAGEKRQAIKRLLQAAAPGADIRA